MKRIIALVSLGFLLLACDPPEVDVPVSSVSLDKTSVELKVGETVRLSATVLPADAKDKTVTWTSSSQSVATVSPTGEVKAVAVGSASITASAGGKSASCSVKVSESTVSVTSVTLDKDRLDLTVGGTAKLTATVLPADASDKTVTWESSDTSVATVDNDGNVKALKGGTSTVTAKAGGKSASALVDVMDVTPTSFDVAAEGGDIQVTVVTPRKYNVESKPEWVTEASVANQVHTFKVAANEEITERSGAIVISDEAGTKFSCEVKQAGAAKVFSVSPEKVDLGADGGTFEVTVTANYPTHLSSTPDWVTQKSVKDGVYTFEATANVAVTDRSGVIVFCDDEGVCLPCSVKQAGAAKVFSVSPEKVNLAAGGGTFEVTVTANYPTHLSSTPDWVTQKSMKDGVYTFEAAANEAVTERSGVIVFCDDEGVCLPCSVKQAGAAPFFSISPEKVDMKAEGGTFTVTVTANHPYHLSSTPDWVTKKSEKDGVYTFEAAANEAIEERSGVIVFCDDEGVCLPCSVKQAGAAKFFSVSPEKVDLGADGGSFEVTVTANYPTHLSSTPDWVTKKSEKDGVYTFEAAANDAIEERSGVIVFCDDEGVCLPCSVKQAAAAKVFSVSPEKVDLKAEGGTFEVTVTANYPTHLSSTPDWVTKKSEKDGVYTFEAAANDAIEERSGVIVFCDDEGVCLPCSVKQAGADVYLTVAPESFEFDPKGGNVSVTVKTNDEWKASSGASWCTVSPASGSGDGTLKITVGEYGGQGRRNATVTIKTGKGLVKTVAADQYGIVPFEVAPYSVDIAQEGGTFDVKVTSSYGYHISGMSDWISEVSMNNKVHTFRVAENPGFETRKGVVTFCDDEGTCLSVDVRQAKRIAGPDVVDWSKDFYHRSLVMFFSSSWEGRSPTYERKIKDVQARVPGKIEKLCFYDSRNEIFFEDVETLISAYDVNWSPTCVIDGRKKAYEYWGSDDLYLMIMESLEEIESAFPTVSAIGWSSSFSGNKLTVDTHIFVKEAGDYKYTVLLLEDGVKCEQYDDGVYEENYVHDGVARIALTGITGESFKTYSSNTVKSKKFTVTIPDSYVKENLRILVYVQRAYGKMQKVSSTDFDGYFVDNCSSGKAGETKLPSIVTVTSGDNEDATEGKPINW